MLVTATATPVAPNRTAGRAGHHPVDHRPARPVRAGRHGGGRQQADRPVRRLRRQASSPARTVGGATWSTWRTPTRSPQRSPNRSRLPSRRRRRRRCAPHAPGAQCPAGRPVGDGRGAGAQAGDADHHRVDRACAAAEDPQAQEPDGRARLNRRRSRCSQPGGTGGGTSARRSPRVPVPDPCHPETRRRRWVRPHPVPGQDRRRVVRVPALDGGAGAGPPTPAPGPGGGARPGICRYCCSGGRC